MLAYLELLDDWPEDTDVCIVLFKYSHIITWRYWPFIAYVF